MAAQDRDPEVQALLDKEACRELVRQYLGGKEKARG